MMAKADQSIKLSGLKILVVIANHGNGNNLYLRQLLNEYRKMPGMVDIVVLSNIFKNLGDDIEVVVGCPTADPWSLPFGHKQIFFERMNQYDLFIYSEDDILVTQKNIEAFLQVSPFLDANQLAGFLRFEKRPDGTRFYPDAHLNFHWDARYLEKKAECIFAYFTNEHAATYILTRQQLQSAVNSGGFMVPPHVGKYHLPESAATDPYTQCGFKKMICISRLHDFIVHHLPNKYVGKMGTEEPEFERQIGALIDIATKAIIPSQLLDTHKSLEVCELGKNYYEPAREDLVQAIPPESQAVLSIGCGWGATEQRLAQTGRKVVAVPADSVISACVEARGIEVANGDLNTIVARLMGRKFDCLLFLNSLHVMTDPAHALTTLLPLLTEDATVVISVPNLNNLSVKWRKLRRLKTYQSLGDYQESGLHFTSHRTVREWLSKSGFRTCHVIDVLPENRKAISRKTRRLFDSALSSEIIAIAGRA
jgi:SAM-dependent methyltransferase